MVATYLSPLVGKDLINYDLVKIALPHLDTGKSISGDIIPEQTADEQISHIQAHVSAYGNEARKQFSVTLGDNHMTITRMG